MPFPIVRLGPLAREILDSVKRDAAQEIRATYSHSGPKFASLKALIDLLHILLPLDPMIWSFATSEVFGTHALRMSDVIGWRVVLHLVPGNPDEIIVHYMHRVSGYRWPDVPEVMIAMTAEFRARGIP